jgi:hypothetical protein
VWAIIVLIIIIEVGGTLFFATKANYIQMSDWSALLTTVSVNVTATDMASMAQYTTAATDEQIYWQIAFWISAVLSLLTILAIAFLWRAIKVRSEKGEARKAKRKGEGKEERKLLPLQHESHWEREAGGRVCD